MPAGMFKDLLKVWKYEKALTTVVQPTKQLDQQSDELSEVLKRSSADEAEVR